MSVVFYPPMYSLEFNFPRNLARFAVNVLRNNDPCYFAICLGCTEDHLWFIIVIKVIAICNIQIV